MTAAEDRHKDLLARADAALAGIEATAARAAKSHERLMRRMDRREKGFAARAPDIRLRTQPPNLKRDELLARIERMREEIRADTARVLAAVERFEGKAD